MGEVGLEKETLESRKQTIHKHASWSLKLPSEGRARSPIKADHARSTAF